MLFLQGSVTVLLLDLFQGGNSLDVAPELFLRPTCAQVVIHDAEIPRRRLRERFRLIVLLETRTQSFSRRLFDGSDSLSIRFGVFLLKAIQLTGIQPAQQRRNLVPAKIAHSQTLFICVQNFQLNTFGRCPVVCGIASFQLHCFHNVGIGPAQPLGNLAIALTRAQQLGKFLFIRRSDQTMNQHITQVLVHCFGIQRQELGCRLIAGILTQHLFKPFPALGPVDGVAHAGRKQLYCVLPELRDAILPIFQIYCVAHMVGRGRRVIGFFIRDGLPNGFVFLIGHSDVDLMDRVTVSNGDGVPRAGDGLTG